MTRQNKASEAENLLVVDVPVRVRYADTDKMGVVYYGTYPMYFEIARSEYMRDKGFTYREFEKMGYYLMVVNLEAKYYGGAEYDDQIVVRTTMPELRSRGLTFRYQIYKDDALLVEGSTRHVCVNNDKRAVAIPTHLLDALRNARIRQ